MYCHSCGTIGRSSYRHLRYCSLYAYYMKILKPKKDAAKGNTDLDDYDFDEDEETEYEDDFIAAPIFEVGKALADCAFLHTANPQTGKGLLTARLFGKKNITLSVWTRAALPLFLKSSLTLTRRSR